MRETTTHERVGISYSLFSIVSDDYEEDGKYETDKLTIVGRTYLHVVTGDREEGIDLTITTSAAAPDLVGEWEQVEENQVAFGGRLRVFTPTGPWGLTVDTGSPGPMMIRVATRWREQGSPAQETFVVQIWPA